ncbi:MAG: transposase [Actinobacteria bacterium]|nr:transposase [Actinomycetota bacterium]
MYKHHERQMIMPEDFYMPFGGKLDPNNRWCKLAAMIPWADAEDKYKKHFGRKNGQTAYSVRVALGSLIIQQQKGLSDRDLVEDISENPYLQYFIGYSGFSFKKPFDPSMMVHFRKRLGVDIINEINELIATKSAKPKDKDPDSDPPGGSGSPESSNKKAVPNSEENAGTLILDATCAPADIHYPTDLWLLNEAREALEEIIDVLH